ncbi:hypothetical protein CDAR_204911 [Caerostris darwini]|uniref:Uncharacterized protein n=1 Tax=Caerostris darwini TaxID=1538125 RepID=A0AAV4PFG2_9ARAC|nr:hypothetical protein CDAR_204911 [Caerostris darwini]
MKTNSKTRSKNRRKQSFPNVKHVINAPLQFQMYSERTLLTSLLTRCFQGQMCLGLRFASQDSGSERLDEKRILFISSSPN